MLYWFFPRRCVLCGDVVAIDDDLCDLCRVNPRIGSAPCDKCGKDKSRCECKNAHNTPDYERIVAPFYYEGNIIKAGFASTAALPEDVRNGMVLGSHVRLILFLKRGKDGMKHNYVAEVF